MDAYQLKQQEILEQFSTDPGKGLAAEDAQRRLEEHGPNEISSSRRVSPLMILLHQFKSPVVYLLLLAMGLSMFFKEWLDATAIAVVILLNAVIGFIMEFQAERSMEALQKMTSQSARVLRGGRMQEIPSAGIVPGDIMLLDAGDMVQADGRILESTDLQADESALTGESLPVDKSPGELPADTQLAERTNMVYKGTFVRNGNGKVLCTATGMKTELGHIAHMVAGAKKAATPLEKKLESFSKRLIGITVVIVVLIFGAGLLNKEPVLEMLKTSIALAVAAIPEGLPVVATLALARGMIRMARQNVIVKKLSAVETLGATTVICTDKTGTLTENRMEVTNALLPAVEWRKKEEKPEEESFHNLQRVAVLCNNASLDGEKGIGDPIEVSLLNFVQETGADVAQIREKFHKLKEAPFNSDTRVMGTLHKGEEKHLVSAKGAIENLLDICSHSLHEGETKELAQEERDRWMQETEKLASSGLKTLGFAYRELNGETAEFMENLVFLGIAGLMDPPRQGVQEVIDECHGAGIRVIMLTGDHPATAAHIAYELGISENEQDVITGKQLEGENDAWATRSVFARVSPKQKLDLVNALQSDHQIVAMTGDGVNDAPALKKADIGIAMGIRGTQVSQEVADMVLKDDAFESIVTAVRQGRVIFTNIKRFIVFLLSCNLSELLVIGLVATAGLPFQLAAIQILFINLITDVFPAMALGFTEGDDTVMQQKPLDPRKPIIGKKAWGMIWFYAAVIGGSALGAAFTAEHFREGEVDVHAANNVMFYTLILSQLLHALNMNEGKEKFLGGPLMRNPYLVGSIVLSAAVTLLCLFIPPVKEALRLEMMPRLDWLLVAGFSVAGMLVIRLGAAVFGRRD
ncbi:cation-translocating P-type ATPase [Chitinophaga sp. GCM10012297]|uniref:Cation-translocating P-type ATPase n=1 Tax=Chitinophaga chungangae TaxID=2821488 RepID=A0ABS3YC49_9BACT|nr:cation-translocating P-type ATPase [Chitinophaga chungangae]MBO9152235.1 cation-translocating P-type ATPase [Chitinophaga chungangae]